MLQSIGYLAPWDRAVHSLEGEEVCIGARGCPWACAILYIKASILKVIKTVWRRGIYGNFGNLDETTKVYDSAEGLNHREHDKYYW